MKIQHFNYLLTFLVGYMVKVLIPQYQAAASIPEGYSYIMDTVGHKVEIDRFATITTPPLEAASPEAQLDKWSYWYNEGDYALEELLRDASNVKGASVRAMLSNEFVTDPDNPSIKIPKMRIVYDDCKSGSCLTYNYGHLEPKKTNGKWFIRKLAYPNARDRIPSAQGVWVLKAPNDLPYDRRAYIQEWYPTALEHQRKYKIPWQIKMAQAVLESNAGKSRLARLANQHFAIKAPKGYKGATLNNRDEGPSQWKFIAHRDAAESWEFHTQFLKQYSRYDDVFALNPDSTYTLPYTHNKHAFDYQYHVKTGKKIPKLVYHKVNGKIELLKEGKFYTFSGLEWAAIRMSAAGYGTDRKYSLGLMATINAFSQPNEVSVAYADLSSSVSPPRSSR